MSKLVPFDPLCAWCRQPVLPGDERIHAEPERLHDACYPDWYDDQPDDEDWEELGEDFDPDACERCGEPLAVIFDGLCVHCLEPAEDCA